MENIGPILNDWIARLKFALIYDESNLSAMIALLLLCLPLVFAYGKGRGPIRHGALLLTVIAVTLMLTTFDLRGALICWSLAWICVVLSVSLRPRAPTSSNVRG